MLYIPRYWEFEKCSSDGCIIDFLSHKPIWRLTAHNLTMLATILLIIIFWFYLVLFSLTWQSQIQIWLFSLKGLSWVYKVVLFKYALNRCYWHLPCYLGYTTVWSPGEHLVTQHFVTQCQSHSVSHTVSVIECQGWTGCQFQDGGGSSTGWEHCWNSQNDS